MKLRFITLLVVFSFIQFGFSQEVFSKWKELDDYNTLFVKTYEPATNGDFSAIKNSCNELGVYAESLLDDTLSPDFSAARKIEILHNVVRKSKTLSDDIYRGATNDQIKEKFDALNIIYQKFLIQYKEVIKAN